MSDEPHGDVFAQGSAEQSEGEQSGLGDTPHFLYGKDFIQHGYGEGHERQNTEINQCRRTELIHCYLSGE